MKQTMDRYHVTLITIIIITIIKHSSTTKSIDSDSSSVFMKFELFHSRGNFTPVLVNDDNGEYHLQLSFPLFSIDFDLMLKYKQINFSGRNNFMVDEYHLQTTDHFDMNATIKVISEKKSLKTNNDNKWKQIEINAQFVLPVAKGFLPITLITWIERVATSDDGHIDHYQAKIKCKFGSFFTLDYQLKMEKQSNLFVNFNRKQCPYIRLNHTLQSDPPEWLYFQSSIEHSCPKISDLRIMIQSKSKRFPLANLELLQTFNLDTNGNEMMQMIHPIIDAMVAGFWQSIGSYSIYQKTLWMKVKPWYEHIKLDYIQQINDWDRFYTLSLSRKDFSRFSPKTQVGINSSTIVNPLTEIIKQIILYTSAIFNSTTSIVLSVLSTMESAIQQAIQSLMDHSSFEWQIHSFHLAIITLQVMLFIFYAGIQFIRTLRIFWLLTLAIKWVIIILLAIIIVISTVQILYWNNLEKIFY
ncbi:uncharacterized protein LOC124492012 [Dermatophagoides farinae]|uniref:uncharacterized protein LOC124492012 n=1 Tax=Dermatophagoides farinae TaxID=6954 RepID=UPI003F63B68E